MIRVFERAYKCLLCLFLIFICAVCIRVWIFYHQEPRLRSVDISDASSVNQLRNILGCEWKGFKFEKCVVENDFYVVGRLGVDVSSEYWNKVLEEMRRWDDAEMDGLDAVRFSNSATEALVAVGYDGKGILLAKEKTREAASPEYAVLREYVVVLAGESVKLYVVANAPSREALAVLKYVE
jgi:hypothetical protein